MLDDNTIDFVSFTAEVGELGTIRIPDDKLKILRQKGISNIKVDISVSIDEVLSTMNVDAELFYAVKETQAVPDNIILGFLRSKGKLKGTNFGTRLKDANE